MKRSALIISGLLAASFPLLAQNQPTSLQVTRIYNITSTWPGDCGSGGIDNRSQFLRQNNYHSFIASGSGSWSVTMQWSDTSCTGPWTSYGSAAVVNQTSNPPIGYGDDGVTYHQFISFVITGNPTINYSAAKDFFLSTSVGAIVFPLSVTQGGTGVNTIPLNTIPYGQGNSAMATAGPGTQYQVFQAGASGVPQFTALHLDQSAAITGNLPVTNGGTGASTASGARANLSAAASGSNSDITALTGLSTPLSTAQGGTGVASPTAHTVPVAEGASPVNLVGPGTAGQVLTSNGPGQDPSFQSAAAISYISQSTYNFSAQTPAESLTGGGGAQTFTLAPVPLGVNGSDTGHRIFLKSTSGVTISSISTPSALLITNMVNNGGGLCRATIPAHGLSTGTAVYVEKAAWSYACNGIFTVTAIDANTVDLQGSSFSATGYQARTNGLATPLSVFTTSGVHSLSAGETVFITGLSGLTGPYGATASTIYGKVFAAPTTTTFTLKKIYFTGAYGGGGTVAPAEAALITGGTATSGGASGTIQISPANSYTGGSYQVLPATAGLQEAINIAKNSLPAAIYLQGNQVWYDGVNLNALSNIALVGTYGQTSIELESTRDGYAGIYDVGVGSLIQMTVSANVNCGGGTALTDTCRAINEAYTVPVTNATGVSPGDYLLLSYTDSYKAGGGNQQFYQMVTAETVSGNTIGTTDAVVIPLNTANTGYVQKESLLSNVQISGLIFDGAFMSSENSYTIELGWARDSILQDITMNNILTGASTGAGIYMPVGYRNRNSNIRMNYVTSRSAGADWYPWYQTGLIAEGISSYEGSFGPELVYCTNCNISNVTSQKTRGRGVKCQGCVANNWTNVIVEGSEATGFGIQGGSYRNNVSNITISGVVSGGMYLSGEGNIYNNFANYHGWMNNLEVPFDGSTVTATTAGISTTITLSGHQVLANESGAYLLITGGNNFTPGLYTINSVDTVANTWTLNTNVSTGAANGLKGVGGYGELGSGQAFGYSDDHNVFDGYDITLFGPDSASDNQFSSGMMARAGATLGNLFSIGSGGTFTVPLDTLMSGYKNTLSFFSTTTHLFTVPPGGDGVYNLTCTVEFPAAAGGTTRTVGWQKNGSITNLTSNQIPSATGVQRVTVTGSLQLVQGDQMACSAIQDSGGNLNIAADGYTWATVSKAF